MTTAKKDLTQAQAFKQLCKMVPEGYVTCDLEIGRSSSSPYTNRKRCYIGSIDQSFTSYYATWREALAEAARLITIQKEG